MDKLDQLHVVSDLHLGGVPEHQIMNQGRALGRVIAHLAALPADQQVGLVLDGDIVDFLAARNAAYLDPEGAVTKLQAIFDDGEFAPVWSALAAFAAAPGRVLVLVLGNHDVELALPRVQDLLLARLTGGDPAARGRIRVAMDGTGYACVVGGRRVLCVHGNDADPWNVVDQGQLRHVIRAQNQGQRPDPWEPNAGTRLVIDVMNDIKRRYPFVDLLKPETTTVPSVLMALPEQLHPPLFDFARITLRLVTDKARQGAGFLGAEAETVPADGRAALDALVARTSPEKQVTPRRAADTAREGEDLLRIADQDFSRDLRPADVVGQDDRLLGIGDIVRDRLLGKDPREDLRRALAEYLAGDRTFLFDTEDATFQALDAEVGPEVTFVVAGHTHLERRLPRRRGGGVYFNSGTWIRLVKIPERALATPESFDPLYRVLTGGSLADLDRSEGLVVQRRTIVAIWKDGAAVRAELRHGKAIEDEAEIPWDPVPGTSFSCAAMEA